MAALSISQKTSEKHYPPMTFYQIANHQSSSWQQEMNTSAILLDQMITTSREEQ
jgi:hypothetical protein